VSGSSISNGCQAKTERRRQLARVGTGRGGTKLHASVAGSRVTAFLATAAPWEPYFTDSPRTNLNDSLFIVDVRKLNVITKECCSMTVGFFTSNRTTNHAVLRFRYK
jgi:hypothetical protein